MEIRKVYVTGLDEFGNYKTEAYDIAANGLFSELWRWFLRKLNRKRLIEVPNERNI